MDHRSLFRTVALLAVGFVLGQFVPGGSVGDSAPQPVADSATRVPRGVIEPLNTQVNTWFEVFETAVERGVPPDVPANPKFLFGQMYAQHMHHFREKGLPVNFLEIGLGCNTHWGPGKGYQLHVNFVPKLQYHAIELQKDCFTSPQNALRTEKYITRSEIDYVTSNTVFGSQADIDVMNQAISNWGPFDMISDDGSHAQQHVITSFEHLFVKGLRPGGIYFIEDIGTAFLSDYGGDEASQKARRTSAVYLSDLVVSMMRDKNSPPVLSAHVYHPIVHLIESIDCHWHGCAIRKKFYNELMVKHAARLPASAWPFPTL